jgi:hypothetical protein
MTRIPADWETLAEQERWSEAADALLALVEPLPPWQPLTRAVFTLRAAEYLERAGRTDDAIAALESVTDDVKWCHRAAQKHLARLRGTR